VIAPQRFQNDRSRPAEAASAGEFARRPRSGLWYLLATLILFGQKAELLMWILLLLPFIGLLWVPFYNFLEPSLFGFPFFYWYQLAWVPISSLLIWLVYRSRSPDDAH
jgi:hypothetical protein